MTRMSELHTSAFMDHETSSPTGQVWHSLPPHVPGECWGKDGKPCPNAPDEPCEHNHRSSRSAIACSRHREPFKYDESIWDEALVRQQAKYEDPDPEAFAGEAEFARKYATGKHYQLTVQEAGNQRGRIPYTKSSSYTADELMTELERVLRTTNLDTTITIKRNK